MNWYALSGLFTFLTSLAFSLFSWIKGKRFLNKLWAVFCLCVAIWGIGCFKFSSTLNQDHVFFWLRFGHIGVILMPAFFLHFIFEFLELRKKTILTLAYGVALFFLGINIADWFGLTALLIASLRFVFNSFYVDSPPAPLYPTFLMYFFGTILYAHYVAIKQYRSCTGLKRNQLKYFLAATILGFAGGWTSFFMVFGIDIYPTLHMTVPLYPVIMTYAIVNYKLMDIEVVIKRTLVFAGIFAFFYGLFAFLSFLVTDVLQRTATGSMRLWIFAAGAAIAALVVNRLHSFLVNATDRFLFQKKYVYYRLLKENSKQMAFIHSLDELAKQITGFLIRQGRIKNAAIFVQSDDGQHYVLKFPLGYGGRTKRPTITLDQNHPLVELLRTRQGPIQTEELEGRQETKGQEAVRILKLLKAELAIPSFLRTASNVDQSALSPRNILILGPKKSDQPYSEEDLDVFFTIAQDSAIAAENARLFDVVLKEREAKIKAEHVAERVWFAGTIKHEVRNRLAAGIIGPANVLRIHHAPDLKKAFDEGDKEWFQEIFSKIENIIKGLLDGAQMILDIADTTLGGLEPDQTKFRRIYFKIVWNDAKKASGVEEHCDFESSIPDGFVIYGNYPVLMRVFENLLTNAYDAMKDQNEKLIKLRCSYQQIEGKQVSYCELEDNGHGMPEEIQSKIFERGFSTKPKPDDKDLVASGHGQGLYVCKMNIEKIHGGKIWVESKVGKGTILKFWIPTEGSNNAEK